MPPKEPPYYGNGRYGLQILLRPPIFRIYAIDNKRCLFSDFFDGFPFDGNVIRDAVLDKIDSECHPSHPARVFAMMYKINEV